MSREPDLEELEQIIIVVNDKDAMYSHSRAMYHAL